MTDTHNIDIPAQMIEAAAKVLNDADLEWDEWTEEDREENRREASKALAAAFAECEVTEQWGVASGGDRPGVDGFLSIAKSEKSARAWIADPDTTPGCRLVRRFVITTAAVVVTPAQESQDGS